MMHTMDDIGRSFSSGYEQGAKDYKEQRNLLLQKNAELIGKIEQLAKERDAAIACIEALKDDFVEYVCSGASNTNPYCANKTDDCTDKRGWCVYVKNCRGFKPKAYEEWRGIDETD